jgi:hypothetical protein
MNPAVSWVVFFLSIAVLTYLYTDEWPQRIFYLIFISAGVVGWVVWKKKHQNR